MANDCADTAFKVFLFLIILAPISIVTIALFLIGLIANIFVLLYFVLIEWICELKISECHEPILVKALTSPWKLLTCFLKKLKHSSVNLY